MSFPGNFPSVGVWKVTFFDVLEEGHPLHISKMFVDEYLGDYKLLREKTKYGWKYRLGEMDSCIYKTENGYAMRTWMSTICLVSAKKVN